MSTDPFAQLDAAYALHALSDRDRADFEAHLVTCAACRDGVTRARATVDLLGEADETWLDPVGPPIPDTLLPGLLAAARRERRLRRWVAAGIAGLAAACVLALVALLVTPRPTSVSARRMVAVQASPVHATAALQSTAWGTRISLTCWYGAGANGGYLYSVTVHAVDGTVTQLGSWRLGPGNRVHFTTGTALPTSQIRTVDITDASGANLLELRR